MVMKAIRLSMAEDQTGEDDLLVIPRPESADREGIH